MTEQTILIADDDQDLLESLSMRCRRMGFAVEQSDTAMGALSKISFLRPSVVCLDVRMPPGNGIAVAEMLMDGDETVSRIPVIVVTNHDNDEIRRRAEQIGAGYVRKGKGLWGRLRREILRALGQNGDATEVIPITSGSESESDGTTEGDAELMDGDFLGAVFDFITNKHDAGELFQSASDPADEPTHPLVLMIDDDPDFSWCLQKRLEKYGITALRAFEGMQGYRTAFSQPVDAIICDYYMPNGRGDYTLRRLKENPVTKDIPVIVLTGHKDASLERKALNLGAARLMTKPYNIDELVAELRRQFAEHERLKPLQVRSTTIT